MVAKNINGKSFKSCVSYVINDTAERLENKGILTDSTKIIIRSFAIQRYGRKEIKQPDGTYSDIFYSQRQPPQAGLLLYAKLAKKYTEEIGIKNTKYIIVRHHNTDNEHLHIVYNRIDNNLKLIFVNNDYKQNISKLTAREKTGSNEKS